MTNTPIANYFPDECLLLNKQLISMEDTVTANNTFSHEVLLIIQTLIAESPHVETVEVMKKIMLVLSNQPEIINNKEKKNCFNMFSKVAHLFLLNAWPTDKPLPYLIIYNAEEAKKFIIDEYQASELIWLYDLLDDFEHLSLYDLVIRVDEIFNDLSFQVCGKLKIPDERSLRDNLRLKVKESNNQKAEKRKNNVFT